MLHEQHDKWPWTENRDKMTQVQNLIQQIHFQEITETILSIIRSESTQTNHMLGNIAAAFAPLII
jgi:hypothetical protein